MIAHFVELDNDISRTGAVIDLINTFAVPPVRRGNGAIGRRSNLISECLRDDADAMRC